MTGVTLRPFDPERDFPAIAQLIADVNANAGADWFPTLAELTVEWSRARTFDPLRDPHLDCHSKGIRGGRHRCLS